MQLNVKQSNQSSEKFDYFSQETFKEIDKIKENYKKLTEDTKKIAYYCSKEEITKPTTIYNLFFCVEIHLKYYLLITSTLNLTEIEGIGHNIGGLIIEAKNNTPENLVNFENLNTLLKKFKTSKNKALDLSEYENFRYNKHKKSANLIFNDYVIKKEEKENIKDVLEWMSLNI